MDLETAWYVVMGLSVLMYTVLDGFDLGVGALHLFARTDEDRRMFLNAIGPVWDGNEVWIVVIIGGLFAGFPNAYATVFTGFYTLLTFLIAGLMFRAAAIEFRSKGPSPLWRGIWDTVFCLASLLVALVIGVILGNLIQGVAINATQDYIGTFSDLLTPYALLVGVLAVALFSMHGSIYLYMKTEGEAHAVVRRWIFPSIIFFLVLFTLTTLATLLYMPHMAAPFYEHPMLLILPFLALGAIASIPHHVKKRRGGWAFLASCASICLLLSLFHVGTYPYILHSTIDKEINSLTIYNCASSPKTLTTLLIVVAIGGPLVLAYGFFTYRIFRGKVKLEKSSY